MAHHEPTLDKNIEWKIHKTPVGLGLFIIIGFMAGMFGLGAGWANVPVLNLVLGAPIKISVATSKFLLSITDTSAAWIYLNNGYTRQPIWPGLRKSADRDSRTGYPDGGSAHGSGIFSAPAWYRPDWFLFV